MAGAPLKDRIIMRKTILIAAAFGLLAATPAIARPSICIRQDDIRNWTSLNDKQLVLENYHHQKALLGLIGTCGGFKFAEALVIRSPGSFSGLDCVSKGDQVTTRQSGFRGTCAVVSIEPYAGTMNQHADSAGHHDGSN
jgi:hypothetical protein